VDVFGDWALDEAGAVVIEDEHATVEVAWRYEGFEV
jgi:hypothetical protein